MYFIVKTFKMRSILKKLSIQNSIVTYRHDVVRPISRTYLSCIIDTLCLLFSYPLLTPHPRPWQPPCYSLIYKFNYFRDLTQVESWTIYPSVTGLFHLSPAVLLLSIYPKELKSGSQRY